MDKKHPDYTKCKAIGAELIRVTDELNNLQTRGGHAEKVWKVEAANNPQLKKILPHFHTLHGDAKKRWKEMLSLNLETADKNLAKYASGKALKEKHKKALASLKQFKAGTSTFLMLLMELIGAPMYPGMGDPHVAATVGYMQRFEEAYDKLETHLTGIR